MKKLWLATMLVNLIGGLNTNISGSFLTGNISFETHALDVCPTYLHFKGQIKSTQGKSNIDLMTELGVHKLRVSKLYENLRTTKDSVKSLSERGSLYQNYQIRVAITRNSSSRVI